MALDSNQIIMKPFVIVTIPITIAIQDNDAILGMRKPFRIV